jgi:hypothetical protein
MMNNTLIPDDDAPSRSPDWQDLLRRLTVLEQNQRDMLFLLRSMRHSFHSERQTLSAETKRIHRAVIRMEPFSGSCPCCLETRVVDEAGRLIPPAEYDHFWGVAYSAPVHSWLICQACHRALTNDRHLTWYHRLITRFRRYQAAVQAYTSSFSHRTPARVYMPPRRP